MFDYAGIVYRIFGVAGIIFLLGIVLLLFEKPWKKNFSIFEHKFSLFAMIYGIVVALFYLSYICFPKVSCYTGEFVDTHRNSRVAPPLPFTYQYVFDDKASDDLKQTFYLDIYSKKKIFPYDFEQGIKYAIYYDEHTNVIVKVEKLE